MNAILGTLLGMVVAKAQLWVVYKRGRARQTGRCWKSWLGSQDCWCSLVSVTGVCSVNKVNSRRCLHATPPLVALPRSPLEATIFDLFLKSGHESSAQSSHRRRSEQFPRRQRPQPRYMSLQACVLSQHKKFAPYFVVHATLSSLEAISNGGGG